MRILKKSFNTTVTYFCSVQGVLLHPNGEVRASGSERGGEERGGAARDGGVRAVPSAEPPLQQEQPH